ncbi:uncharacterized protein LOC100201507 isoform X9 [Hydra vulgaris]|uniref:Uncharacterized protein LOC100201507 isoform X9 n=1 Tax=Hydra vulgaris TaxID=6087 RepID=A0ABM4BHJ6_HYDVU
MQCLLIFFLLVIICIKSSYLKRVSEKKHLYDDEVKRTSLFNRENGKEVITPVVAASLRYPRTIKKSNSSKGSKRECTCPENQKVHSYKPVKAVHSKSSNEHYSKEKIEGDGKKKCECVASNHFDSSTAHSSSHRENNYLQDISGVKLIEQSGNGMHGSQSVNGLNNQGRRSNCGFNVDRRKNEFQLNAPIENYNHPIVQGSNYNDDLCPGEDDHGFVGTGVISNLNNAYQKNFDRLHSQIGFNENYMGNINSNILGLGARLTNHMDNWQDWQNPDVIDYSKQVYGSSNPEVLFQNDPDSLNLINMGLEMDNKLLLNDIQQQNNRHNSQTINSKSIMIHEKPFKKSFITQDLSATIGTTKDLDASIGNEYENHPTFDNSRSSYADFHDQCKDCEYNELYKNQASEHTFKSLEEEDEHVFSEIFSNFLKKFGNKGFSFKGFLRYLQKKAKEENYKKNHEKAMENYLSTVKKYFEDKSNNNKYEKNDESSEGSGDDPENQSSMHSNNIDSEDFIKEKYDSSNFRKDPKDPFYFLEKGDYGDDVSFQKAIQSLPLREVSFFPKRFFHDKRFHSGGIGMLLKMFYSSSNAQTKGCQKKNCADENDSSFDDETSESNSIKTKHLLNDEGITVTNDKHRQKKPKSFRHKEFQSETTRDQDHWNRDNRNVEHQSFNSYSQGKSHDENSKNSFKNEEFIPKTENDESAFDKKKTLLPAFDSEERVFFPCPFQSEKNKVMICYHTKNGVKYLNTVRLEDHALENLEKFNKNSELKILNKVHDLMKFDEQHFASQIGSIFPSSEKIKERDKLLRKLEIEKIKDKELMKSKIFSAEEKAIENLAKKIGHGDPKQGAAILSQIIDESEYIQSNSQPLSDIRKGNVIEIKSDRDAADGILKVTEPISSESPTYILNKIRNNNATKRNTGPVHLLPSHNGGLLFDTTDFGINEQPGYESNSVEAIKKSLFFKPGQTLQTPYGSLKLVPVDEPSASSPSNTGASTFSATLPKSQPMTLNTAAKNDPIKIQIALEPLTLKALTEQTSAGRDTNYNNVNGKDIETLKTMALARAVPTTILSEPPKNDIEKNLAFKQALSPMTFDNTQAIHADPQLITIQKSINKAASDAVNVAIELISTLDTIGSNNGGATSNVDGATSNVGEILEVGGGSGKANLANGFVGLVANSTSINQNSLDGKPESVNIQSNGKTENLSQKRIRRDVDKASHGLQRDVFYLESLSKINIEALTASHKFPGKPDVHGNIEEFDVPINFGDKYGQRVHGWFLPPQSGKYIFYTSCDDECEFYISNNDDPKNKKIIIAQDDWSKHNEWDKYPAQQTSKTIDLQKEQGYYIEALMSDTSGDDHLSVGVRLPDGNLLRPIPNYLLSPIRIVNFPLSFVTIKAVISPEHLIKNTSEHFPAPIKSNESAKRDKTYIVPKNKSYQSTLSGVLENLIPLEMVNPNTRVQIPRSVSNEFRHDQDSEINSLRKNYIHFNNESKESRSKIIEEENKILKDLNPINNNNGANDFINSDKKNKIVNIAAVDDKPEFIPVPKSPEFEQSKVDQPKNLSDDLFFAPGNADFKKIKEIYGGNPNYEDSFQYDDTDHHVGIINIDEESKVQNPNHVENLVPGKNNGIAFYSGQDSSLVINDNQAIEMKNKYSNRGKVVLDFSKGNEYAKIIIYDLRKKPVERKSLVHYPASKNSNSKKHTKLDVFKKSKNLGGKKGLQKKEDLKSKTKESDFSNQQKYHEKNIMNRNYFENHGQNKFESSAQAMEGVRRSQRDYPGINLWIFEKVYRDKLFKGTSIDALYNSDQYPDQPDKVFSLPLMDTGKKTGNNVGQMIWGWLKVPIDGEYTFFSSCDDECDVYMSPDDSKDHIRKIISQRKFSKNNQWDKYPEEQTSPLIRLSSGKAYYIQAVCVQLTGNSGCSVGMQLPNGKMSRPINKEFLSRAQFIGSGLNFTDTNEPSDLGSINHDSKLLDQLEDKEKNRKQHDVADGYKDATDQHELHDFMKTQFNNEKITVNTNSELVTNLLQLSQILMGKKFADELIEKHLHKHLGISKNSISTALRILLGKIKKIRQRTFMKEDKILKKPHNISVTTLLLNILPDFKAVQNLIPQKKTLHHINHSIENNKMAALSDGYTQALHSTNEKKDVLNNENSESLLTPSYSQDTDVLNKYSDKKNKVRRNIHRENGLSDIFKKDDSLHIFSSNENYSQSHSNTVLFGDRSLFQIPQHVTHISQEQHYTNHVSNVNEVKLDLSHETDGIDALKLTKEGAFSTNKTFNEINKEKEESNITDHLVSNHLTESLFNNNFEKVNKIFNSSAVLVMKNKATDINFLAHVNDSVPDSQQSNNDVKTHDRHLDIPSSDETADIGKTSKESLQLESVVLYRKKRDLENEMSQIADKKTIKKILGDVNKKNKRGYKALKNHQITPYSIINQFHDFASALPSHFRNVDSRFQNQESLLSFEKKNSRSFVSKKTSVSKLKKLPNLIKMKSNTSVVGKRKNSIPFSHSVVDDISTAIEVQNPVKNNFVSRAELPEIIGTDGTGSMERIDISHMRAAQPESFSPLPPMLGPTLNGLPLLRSSQIGTKTTVFDLNLNGGGKSSILQLPGTSSQNSITQSSKIFKHDDKTEESFSLTNFNPVSDDSINIPMINTANHPIVAGTTRNKEQELGIDVAPSKSELSRESAINSNPLAKDLHKNIFKEEDIKWSSDLSSSKIKPSALVINNSKVRSLLSDARKSTSSGASKFDWLFNENINDGKRKEDKEDKKFKEKTDEENTKLDKENTKIDEDSLKQDEDNIKEDEVNSKQESSKLDEESSKLDEESSKLDEESSKLDEESSKLNEENFKQDYDSNEYDNKQNEYHKVKLKDPQIGDIFSKERDVDKILHEEMRHYGKNRRKMEDDKWNEEEELTQVPNSKIYDYENEPEFSTAEKEYKATPIDDFHTPGNDYDDHEYNQQNPEFGNGDKIKHGYHHPEKNSRDDVKYSDERNLNYHDDLDEDLPHELNEKDAFHLHARSDDGFSNKQFYKNHRVKSSERFQENRDKDYQDNKRDEPLDVDHLRSFKHFLKDIANSGEKRESLFFHLKKKHAHDMTRRNQVRRTINGLVHIYNSLINEKNSEHKNHVHKYKSPLSLKFEKAKKRSKNYDTQLNFLKKAYLVLQKGNLLHSSNLKTSDSFYPNHISPNQWHQLKEPAIDEDYIINKYLANSEDSKRLEHMLKKEVYDDLEITNIANNKKSKKQQKVKVDKDSSKNLESLEMALKQLSAAAEKNSSKEYEDLIHRLSPYLVKLKEIDSKLNKSQINDHNNTFNLKSNDEEKYNLDKELSNSTEKDESDLELNKIADVGSNLQETKEDLISALENAQAISQKHINNIESHLDVASYRPLLPLGNVLGKQIEKTTNQTLPNDNFSFETNSGITTSNSLSKQFNWNKTSDSYNVELGAVDDIGLAPQPIPVIEDKSLSPEKVTIHFNKSMEETIPISNSVFKIKTPSLQVHTKPNYFDVNSKNFYNKNCEPVVDGVDIPYVPLCHNSNTFGPINSAIDPDIYSVNNPALNPGLYTEKIRIRPINHVVNSFKVGVSNIPTVPNLNSNHYPPNIKIVDSVENPVPINFLTPYEDEPHFRAQPTTLSLDKILQNEASETPSVVLPWQNSFQGSKFRDFYPPGPRISHGFNNGVANNLILNTPISPVTNGGSLYNGLISENANLFEGIEHSTNNKNYNAIYEGLELNKMDRDSDRKDDILKSGGLLKQGKYSVIKKLPVIFKFFDDGDLGKNSDKENDWQKDFDSEIESKSSNNEKLVLENVIENNNLGIKLNEKKGNIKNEKMQIHHNSTKKLLTTMLTQSSNKSINDNTTLKAEEEIYSGDSGESGESERGLYNETNTLKESGTRVFIKKTYKNKVKKESNQNSTTVNNMKESLKIDEYHKEGKKYKKKFFVNNGKNSDKKNSSSFISKVNIILHQPAQSLTQHLKSKHVVQKYIRPPQSPYSNKHQLMQVFPFVPYALQTRMYISCDRPPVVNWKHQKCVGGKCDLYSRGLHSFGLLHSPELLNSFCHSGHCKHCPDYHSDVPFHHHCDEDDKDDSDHCGEHHNDEECDHCCNHGHHHSDEAHHEHECCHHGDSCYREQEHGHDFGGEHCMAHPSEAHPIYYCGPNMDPQHIGQRGHHGESGLGGEGPYHGEIHYERDCEHKNPLPVPVIIKPPPPCHGQNPYEILTTSQMHNGYHPNGYFDNTAIIQMQNPHSTFGEHEHGGPIYAVPIKNQLTYPDEGSDRNYEKRCIPSFKCKSKKIIVDKASIFDLISKVKHRSASQQKQSSDVKEEKKKQQQNLKSGYAILKKLRKVTAKFKHKHSKKMNKGFLGDSNVINFESPLEGNPSDDDEHHDEKLLYKSKIKSNTSPHISNEKEDFSSSFSSNNVMFSKNETNLLPKNEPVERVQIEKGYVDLNASQSYNVSEIELFKSMALNKSSENLTTEHFYYLENGNETIPVPSLNFNETIPASDLFKALYSEKKFDTVTDLLGFSVSGATINKDKSVTQETESISTKKNSTLGNEKDYWLLKNKKLTNKKHEKEMSKKYGPHNQKGKIKSKFQLNTSNNEISRSRKKRGLLDSLTENNSEGKQNNGQLLSIEKNILKLVLNMTNLLLSQDQIEKMLSEEKLISAGNIKSPSKFHDLILLVDVSSAVDELEFTVIQQFMGDFISKVMNDSKISVGVVSFGQFQQMDVQLSKDQQKVQLGISAMKYMGDTGNLTSALKFVDENIYQAEQKKSNIQQLCIILGGIPHYSQNADEIADKLKSQGVEVFAVGIGKMFKTDTLLLQIASIPILGHTLFTDYENLLVTAANSLYNKIKKGWYAYIAKKKKKNEKVSELNSVNKHLNKTAIQQRCEACRKRILSGLGQTKLNELVASKICFACYENQDVGSLKIIADPLQFTSRTQDLESPVLYQNPVITAINEGNVVSGNGVGLAYSPIINAPYQPFGPDRSIAKVVYDGPNSSHQKLEVLDSEELLNYQQHHQEENHHNQVFESEKYDPYLDNPHIGPNYDSSHPNYATDFTHAHSPLAVTSHLTSTQKLIQTPLTTSQYQSVVFSRPLPNAPIATPLVEKVEQNPYEVLISEQLKPKYKPIFHEHLNQFYKNDNHYKFQHNEAENAQLGNQANVLVSLDQSVQPVLQQTFDLEGPDSLSYMQKLQGLSSESEIMYPLKKRRLKVKNALRIPTSKTLVSNVQNITNLEKKSETRSNRLTKFYSKHNRKLNHRSS